MNLAPLLKRLVRFLPPPRVIGDSTGPYLSRWYLLGRPKMSDGSGAFDDLGVRPEAEAAAPFSVMLHCFHRSDNADALHSHPWAWAYALILAGGYLEVRRGRWDLVRGYRRSPGDVVKLTEHDYHRVVLTDGGESWSLFIAGPRRSTSWYFWDPATGAHTHWRTFLARASDSVASTVDLV